jgi:hypothetical protein
MSAAALHASPFALLLREVKRAAIKHRLIRMMQLMMREITVIGIITS